MARVNKVATICEVHRYDDGLIRHLHWKTARRSAASLPPCAGQGYGCSITVDQCQKPKDESGKLVLARPLVPD
ncbi:MAG: hypothetical protein V3R87_01365 [Dehalococcoidia bacterium]